MAIQFTIAFEGDGHAVAPATWGQREIWKVFEREGRSINLCGRMPLPPGVTVQQIADALRHVMSRHQALRTRFRFGDDGAPAEQVLEERGEAALEIIDIEDEDPAAAVETQFALNDLTNFDSAADWPVRMTVLRRRGELTHFLVAYNHMALDLYGLDVVLADLADRDPATGRSRMPLTSMQPVEIAHWQSTAAARRQTGASMRHWERLLRSIPPDRLPYRPNVPEPRYRKIIYDSPAAGRALWSVAEQSRAESGTVLLAAWALALATVTGMDPIVLQLVVNNRFRRGMQESVSPISQHGLCAINTAGRSFDDIIADAWRSQIQACMYAYYDPRALRELTSTVNLERGVQVDTACYFNDRRRASRLQPPAALTGHAALLDPTNRAELEQAALEQTTVVWESLSRPDDRLAIHIDDAPDTLRFLICADTHYLSAPAMEACAHALEGILIDRALGRSAQQDRMARQIAAAASGAMP